MKTVRLVVSSALGGLYSMVILIDMPAVVSNISKIAACFIIVLTAFRFYRVKSFLFTAFVFLFSNLIFLGVIIGIYLLFESDLIAVKNETVYFNIGARGLLLSAFFAYAVSSAAVRLHNRQLSKGDVYTLEIENNGKRVSLFALADTGNRLREPFSDSSVIVVKSDAVRGMFDGESFRLIPASTVSGEGCLKAYMPEVIRIKNSKGSEIIENAYIALSDSMQGDTSAVLNPDILSV